MKISTKKITGIAMLSALAYIVMLLSHMLPPIALGFLRYDAKDVVITIGGFIFGPMTAFAVAVITSLVEALTVGTTGWIGFLMNLIATCAFSVTASFVYSRRKTLGGAVIALVSGTFMLTAAMLLWNYAITPLYMNMERAVIAKMLIPSFLPFNLLKGGINSAVIMLMYKSIVDALRRANLIPASSSASTRKLPVMLCSLCALAVFVVVTLFFMGVLKF